MMNKEIFLSLALTLMLCAGFVTKVYAHGDVTPQAIDTTGLKPLGEEWLEENPYRGNKVAIEIGSSGYNQNCARCHGPAGDLWWSITRLALP